MGSKITYRELVKKLNSLGYIKKSVLETHVILENQQYQSTVVLPTVKPTAHVAEYFLRSVKKNIVEKGIINENSFEKLLSNQK